MFTFTYIVIVQYDLYIYIVCWKTYYTKFLLGNIIVLKYQVYKRIKILVKITIFNKVSI